MTNWENNYVQKNKYTRPGFLLKEVRKIVLHWTANPGATADGHQRYFNGTAIKNKTFASAHIFIDPNEAICIVPLNEVAYHANDNYEKGNGIVYRGVKDISPDANKYSIGVELCVEKNGIIHPDTIGRAVKVITELCKTYKLSTDDIVRHYDVTHKPCPKPFVDQPDNFIAFKKQVDKLLKNVPTVKPVGTSFAYPGVLIKKGSKNEYVRLIQKKLGITVDGNFGHKTLTAVLKFQESNKLKIDGIVGQITWDKLFN